MIGTAAQRRMALAFLDQFVSSVSNFATGVVVARFAGAAEFGEYMLVMMIWLLVLGVHRALVTEPVIISSPAADDRRALLAQGVGAELILGLSVSGVVAAAGLTVIATGARVGMLMLALSPWFASLLIQDYWRAMAFQQRRPGMALANDLIFTAVQFTTIAVFFLVGWRTPEFMITAWGLGATAGALVGLRRSPAIAGYMESRQLMGRLWRLSRWMLTDFLTAFASHHAYLALVALLLSAVDYGGLRAAFTLMGPTIVILHAGASIGLPEASRLTHPADASALRRFARHLTLGTATCIAVYAAAVILAEKQLLGILYGSEFVRFAPLVTLAAIQQTVAAFVFGQGIALKAAGRMRRLCWTRLLAAAASLLSMVALVRWLGTIGAGWAGVATAVYYVAAVYSVYKVELKQPTTARKTTEQSLL
jgi:O-antigen/teichoic acid export membrane protein